MNFSAPMPRQLAILAWSLLGLLLVLFGGIQVECFLRAADMDVRIYYDAAMALRTGQDMFAAWNPNHPLTYIYPPLLAIIFLPLTYLSLELAAVVWTVINVVLLFLCLVIGGKEVMRRADGRLDVATLPVILLCTFLYFTSRIKAELDQGQVDFLVLLGVTLGLVWLRRKPFLCGLVLGIVANIKYQTVIFLPYFVVRGWWQSAFGFVVGVVVAAFSGSLVMGWDLNLEYLQRAFSGVSELFGFTYESEDKPMIFPTEWVESVSLTSTFARWSLAAGWGETGGLVLLLLSALVCLVIGWLLYASTGNALFRGRSGQAGRSDSDQGVLVLVEWTGLMVAAIVFAPQTKMRHLAVLVLVIIFMFQLLVVSRPGVPRWPLLLSAVLFFLAMLLPLQGGEGDWRNAQGMNMREVWRAQGGPIWCLLLMYFTMSWTALKWVSLARRGDRSGGSTGAALQS